MILDRIKNLFQPTREQILAKAVIGYLGNIRTNDFKEYEQSGVFVELNDGKQVVLLWDGELLQCYPAKDVLEEEFLTKYKNGDILRMRMIKE